MNSAKAAIVAFTGPSRPKPVLPRADKRAFSVVDLFCGAGGLSEGFQQAGFEVRAGTDYDPDALATYAANFPKAEVILGDIRAADVKARALSAARSAAVLEGGLPAKRSPKRATIRASLMTRAMRSTESSSRRSALRFR